MTMKHYSFLILAAMGVAAGFASCSSEQDDPAPVGSDDVIRFTAATRQAEDRATDITTSNLTQFFVYGYLNSDGSAYMSNVEVNKTSANTWEYSPVKYWPSGDAIDFYAYAPEGVLPPGTTPLDQIHFTNTGTTDFIYAVSPDMSQPVSGKDAQVKFNFRHALSRITVMLSSTDTKLDVKVNNVTVVGANQYGDFKFPEASTQADISTAPENSIGTWSNLSGKGIAVLHMAQRPDEILTLTPSPVNADTDGNGMVFFIPQDLPFVQGGDYNNEVY
ncbi:MAG: fimbrillin family protein, partial [Muribaculaceae bacterium]|nr:fimbrillin family protein [Muribaculaceae bacterium]